MFNSLTLRLATCATGYHVGQHNYRHITLELISLLCQQVFYAFPTVAICSYFTTIYFFLLKHWEGKEVLSLVLLLSTK